MKHLVFVPKKSLDYHSVAESRQPFISVVISCVIILVVTFSLKGMMPGEITFVVNTALLASFFAISIIYMAMPIKTYCRQDELWCSAIIIAPFAVVRVLTTLCYALISKGVLAVSMEALIALSTAAYCIISIVDVGYYMRLIRREQQEEQANKERMLLREYWAIYNLSQGRYKKQFCNYTAKAKQYVRDVTISANDQDTAWSDLAERKQECYERIEDLLGKLSKVFQESEKGRSEDSSSESYPYAPLPSEEWVNQQALVLIREIEQETEQFERISSKMTRIKAESDGSSDALELFRLFYHVEGVRSMEATESDRSDNKAKDIEKRDSSKNRNVM